LVSVAPARFEQLKRRSSRASSPLAQKPCRAQPHRLIIASGAAVRDVYALLPSLSQCAPHRLSRALQVMVHPRKSSRGGILQPPEIVDVLILARVVAAGDLWLQRREVARAIAASEIPVISGVGHERFHHADLWPMFAPPHLRGCRTRRATRREFDKHIMDLPRCFLRADALSILVLFARHDSRPPRISPPADLLRQQRQRADELTSASLTPARKRASIARASPPRHAHVSFVFV